MYEKIPSPEVLILPPITNTLVKMFTTENENLSRENGGNILSIYDAEDAGNLLLTIKVASLSKVNITS